MGRNCTDWRAVQCKCSCSSNSSHIFACFQDQIPANTACLFFFFSLLFFCLFCFVFFKPLRVKRKQKADFDWCSKCGYGWSQEEYIREVTDGLDYGQRMENTSFHCNCRLQLMILFVWNSLCFPLNRFTETSNNRIGISLISVMVGWYLHCQGPIFTGVQNIYKVDTVLIWPYLVVLCFFFLFIASEKYIQD